jgi:transposase
VPQKSKRRNVFGLFTRNNEFECYETLGSMNSELLVAYIDNFVKYITQKTVMIIDNAPFHHATIVKNKIEEWAKQDLLIWFLPAYSPHLNKIETLWRKIKYEWLKPHDYLNWESLNNALDNIFKNIGNKFTIEFS